MEKQKGECVGGCVCSLYGKFVMFAVPNTSSKIVIESKSPFDILFKMEIPARLIIIF